MVIAALMRLGNLVDFLLDKCPDTTILLAQISAVLDQATSSRIDAYNSKMSSLVTSRAGKHMILVDMTTIKQDQLMTDGVHPNDAAYKIMASQWYDGIQKAVTQGWIKASIGPDPKPDPRSNNQNCHLRREFDLLKPRGTKMGHQCSGSVVWTQLGQIAPGVSHLLSLSKSLSSPWLLLVSQSESKSRYQYPAAAAAATAKRSEAVKMHNPQPSSAVRKLIWIHHVGRGDSSRQPLLTVSQDGTNGDHKHNPSWVRLDADPIRRDGSQVVLADLRGTGNAHSPICLCFVYK